MLLSAGLKLFYTSYDIDPFYRDIMQVAEGMEVGWGLTENWMHFTEDGH